MSWASADLLVLLIVTVGGENTADGTPVLSAMIRLVVGSSAALILTGRTIVLPTAAEDTNSSTSSSLQHCVHTVDMVRSTFVAESCVPSRLTAVQ
jgi:hypothetical protein